MSPLTIVLLGLGGYVLGSLPWGYWVPRFLSGTDIRQVGSSNIGAANVWRAVGFKTFLTVVLLDIGKGSAAAGLGLAVAGPNGAAIAGVGALAGHWRPVFLAFSRGGKIVATTVGVTLVMAPLASVTMAVLWWAVLLATRYTSVASIISALVLPVLVLVFGGSWLEALFTLGAAAVIVVLHRPNIERLRRGTENRITLHRPMGRRRPRSPLTDSIRH